MSAAVRTPTGLGSVLLTYKPRGIAGALKSAIEAGAVA